jgi:hypothetical protein
MRYLYVKYQHPIPNSSKDIAQVKVFSLRCDADADTGVDDNSSPDSRPGELKSRGTYASAAPLSYTIAHFELTLSRNSIDITMY